MKSKLSPLLLPLMPLFLLVLPLSSVIYNLDGLVVKVSAFTIITPRTTSSTPSRTTSRTTTSVVSLNCLLTRGRSGRSILNNSNSRRDLSLLSSSTTIPSLVVNDEKTTETTTTTTASGSSSRTSKSNTTAIIDNNKHKQQKIHRRRRNQNQNQIIEEENEEEKEEKETIIIPSIQSLRKEIRRYSQQSNNKNDFNDPNKAGYALRQMFQYYNPKQSQQQVQESSKKEGSSQSQSQSQPPIPIMTIKEFDQRPRVDVNDCNQVLKAWRQKSQSQIIDLDSDSSSGPASAGAQQALIMLKVMIAMYKHDHNANVRPNIISYNTVMDIFSQQGDFENANNVFKMLLKDYKVCNNKSAKPDTYTFQTMITACSKNMENQKNQKNQNQKYQKNNSNQNNIIMLLPEMSTKLLDTMIELYSKGELKGKGPTIKTYGDVINCWMSKSGTTTNFSNNGKDVALLPAAQGAHRILNKMISNYNANATTNVNVVRPTTFMYGTVLNAYAKCDGGIDGAIEVFHLMKDDYYNHNNTHAKPNTRTYTMLIDAWSKSSSVSVPASAIIVAPAEQAEKLLQEMILNEELENPNIVTYNTVLSCWSNAATATAAAAAADNTSIIPKEMILQRVRAILDSLLSVGGSSNSTNSNDNSNSDSSSNDTTSKNKINIIHPDTVTYTTIMNIYAKLGNPDGANEILQQMKQDYNFGKGNKDAKPNIRTYNTLLNAWSSKKKKKNDNNDNDNNSSNSPKEAEIVLKEIIELHSKGILETGPDIVTYNTVLNCWSKSKSDDGPQRALTILKTMIFKYNEHVKNNSKNHNERKQQQQQTKVPSRLRPPVPPRPNTITYSIVMDAFASQGNVEKTFEVFQMMKEDYNNKHNTNVKPNLIVYNTLIKAYSKYSSKNNNHNHNNNDQCSSSSSTDTDTHDTDTGLAAVVQQVISPPLEVENILKEIISLHKKGTLTEGPSDVTYRLMIVCLKQYYGTEERVRELISLLPPRRTTTTNNNKRRNKFHR
jgi:pentatricopeptide repeat protein